MRRIFGINRSLQCGIPREAAVSDRILDRKEVQSWRPTEVVQAEEETVDLESCRALVNGVEHEGDIGVPVLCLAYVDKESFLLRGF